MKKVITIIAACMLVFAFSGVASAEIVTCSDAGYINRGCETAAEQSSCSTSPFDYEDFYGSHWSCEETNNSYCPGPDKDEFHRALFKICDCIEAGKFSSVDSGDIIDIGMEILVDKKDGNGPVGGNNGVYWAEDVNSAGSNGVGVQPFANQGAACADTSCTPSAKFKGEFDYFLADGTLATGLPYDGNECDVPEEQEIVKFKASVTQGGTHGYLVQPEDATDNLSVWWVDIPMLRADSNLVTKGWDVYVKICMYDTLDTGGVCGDCEGCCYTLLIGTLCCDYTPVVTTCSETLTFPYFPKTTGTYWYGMAVTNLSDEAGSASVTLYEQDGDIFTGTVTVDAHSTRVVDPATDLTLTTSVDGTLGNAKSYATVVTDFDVSGFGMMANDIGASMGYLAEKCGDCGCD
ncbi:MAG: hypothetical protein ACKVE4_10880 [Dissulfuribacterales bacterium]